MPSEPHPSVAPRTASPPRQRAPAGATDCHFHIFGPFDRFPLSSGRRYDPPLALVEEYRAVASVLGLERQVVVQASVLGTDNRCTLDAVAQFGRAQARAVAVIDDGFSHAELRELAQGGVAGVRFNAVSGNGTPLDQMTTIGRRIAAFDWHLQIYPKGDAWPELAPILAKLPVPVVIDHMGGIPAAWPEDHPAVQALYRLLDTGRTWVKLSGYRVSAGPPYDDLKAPAQALIRRAPERMLWGTDWPHTSLDERAMPDDGRLLDLLADWVETEADWKRILTDNPAKLYGFEKGFQT